MFLNKKYTIDYIIIRLKTNYNIKPFKDKIIYNSIVKIICYIIIYIKCLKKLPNFTNS